MTRNSKPNYKKKDLMAIIKSVLPVSAEDWNNVCVKYKEFSKEEVDRDGADVKRYWSESMNKKFQKVYSFSPLNNI